MEIQKLLTVGEVADILKIKRQTVYNKIWKGDFPIPYKKIGALVRFREDEVLAFLEK